VHRNPKSSASVQFPSQPRRSSNARTIRLFIGFIAAINLGISVFASLNDRFGNTRRPREIKLYENLDKVFQLLSHDGAPIFLKFGDLTGSDIGFASTVYFRAVFTMFPSLVLVGDPSASLFFASDILPANMDRSDDWLAAQHVGIVLNVRLEKGTLLVTPRRVSAPPPSPKSPAFPNRVRP
jgi:hypothetical protein